MSNEEFEQRLAKLTQQVDELSLENKSDLEQLIQETRQRRIEVTKSIEGVDIALQDLRLTVKYLMFDLEASKRENTALRKLLESENGEK